MDGEQERKNKENHARYMRFYRSLREGKKTPPELKEHAKQAQRSRGPKVLGF